MDASVLFYLLAALFFVLEAFTVTLGTLIVKWWALGVAAALIAQVATALIS